MVRCNDDGSVTCTNKIKYAWTIIVPENTNIPKMSFRTAAMVVGVVKLGGITLEADSPVGNFTLSS